MKKIPYISFLPMIFITIIGYQVLSKIDFMGNISFFIAAMEPFIWALGIALVLKPVTDFIKKKTKVSEGMSIFLAYLLAILLIGLFILIVAPLLIKSIGELLGSLPGFYDEVKAIIPLLLDKISTAELKDYVSNNISTILGKANELLNVYGGFILGTAVAVTSNLLTLIFGFLISVYILTGRKYFKALIRKFVFASTSEENGAYILRMGYNAIDKFASFVGGKVIDSAIIGVIAFVLFTVFKIPYAMILALVIGVTNMIPYFGPFIGGVPAVALSLFYGWEKALLAGVLVLAIQQFDGWYLGPKILGDKVGLRPFWIILAVILGGAYFGPMGMFLGTPILAVVIDIVREILDKKIEKKMKTDL